MALQAVGVAISFSDITEEFGSPTENRFGNYRLTQQIKDDCPTPATLATFPLDDGIPSSGQIKFSDFYSKKLNVVLDIFNGNTEYTINARDRFNNQPNKRIVIGGFKTLDLDGNGIPIDDGKKIRIIVNKKVGSGTGSVQKCALRTGSWTSSTDVRVDIFGRGRLSGAGGNGGNGALGISGNGTNGGDGGSALGIEKNGTVVTVHSGGVITQGFAGGGGAGGGRQKDKRDRRAGGGGGGGGAGIPAGGGGAGGAPQGGTRDNSILRKDEGSQSTESAGNPTALTLTNSGSGYGPSFLSNSGRSTTLLGGTPTQLAIVSAGYGYDTFTYSTTLLNGDSLPFSGSGLTVKVESVHEDDEEDDPELVGYVEQVSIANPGTAPYSNGSILRINGGYNNARVSVSVGGAVNGSGLRVHYGLVDPCAGNSGIKDLEIVDNYPGNNQYFGGNIIKVDKNSGEGGDNATFKVEDWSNRGVTDTGHDGEAATENFGGAGGRGGNNHDEAGGGRGGNGGDYLNNASNGNSFITGGANGVAGSNGAAIRKTNNSISFSLTDNGTVHGNVAIGVFQD